MWVLQFYVHSGPSIASTSSLGGPAVSSSAVSASSNPAGFAASQATLAPASPINVNQNPSPESEPSTSQAPYTTFMTNLATVGFISNAGWIVSAGHAFTPNQSDQSVTLSLNGLPRQVLSPNVRELIRVYQPNCDLLLANAQVFFDDDATDFSQACLATKLANEPTKSCVR